MGIKDGLIQWSVRTLAAVTLVTVGCGGEPQEMVDGDDAVGVTSAALGEAACRTSSGGLQFDGGVDVFVYPYSTAGCLKAMLVTITNYSAVYLGPGNVSRGGTDISWADAHRQGGPALPRTQAACTETWLGAYAYRWTGASWVTAAVKTAKGLWIPGQGCSPPAVTFTSSQLSAGETYKFAASARMTNSDAAAIAGLTFVSHPPL